MPEDNISDPPAADPSHHPQPYTRRVLLAVGISLGAILLTLFLYYALYVLLLAFAGILLAVLLRGAAGWVARKTGLPVNWSLAVVVVTLAAAFFLLGWLTAPGLTRQANQFARKLPESLRTFEQRVLTKYPAARQLLGMAAAPEPGGGAQEPPRAVRELAPAGSAGVAEVAAVAPPANGATPSVNGAAPPASQPASQPTSQPSTQPSIATKAMTAMTGGDAVGTASRLVQAVIGALVAVIVVVVVGIYLAAQPKLYVRGSLHLLPYRLRPRAVEIFHEVGFVLRRWMVAQLIPMGVIGIVTAVGLKIIGVQMWPTLGLLAALFNFIPNFGPMISFIPAVLFALADDPEKVLWVAALYLFAQSLEGYVLTPLVQRKAVELPPALLILTQVLMGTLGGGIGLVLAAPLTAAALVVIKMAYVREALDDPVKVPSEHVAEEKEEKEKKEEKPGTGEG
jgi:predicted PurR-regulated permease PerM